MTRSQCSFLGMKTILPLTTKRLCRDNSARAHGRCHGPCPEPMRLSICRQRMARRHLQETDETKQSHTKSPPNSNVIQCHRATCKDFQYWVNTKTNLNKKLIFNPNLMPKADRPNRPKPETGRLSLSEYQEIRQRERICEAAGLPKPKYHDFRPILSHDTRLSYSEYQAILKKEMDPVYNRSLITSNRFLKRS